ncbi:hypothetical protein SPW_7337 [Streptomyces sp. W007]|nr:hypothetical protein SPW_7337 [Streptomyces sp. W007]
MRAGHTDDMAHRFLERLCAAGKLGLVSEFGPLLSEMMREDHS